MGNISKTLRGQLEMEMKAAESVRGGAKF